MITPVTSVLFSLALPSAGLGTAISLRHALLVGFLLVLLGVALFAFVGLMKTSENQRRGKESSRKKNRRGKRLSESTSERVGELYDEEDRGEGRRRRRYKKHRREHRPTNPKIGETGGLPPKRPDGEPPEVFFN